MLLDALALVSWIATAGVTAWTPYLLWQRLRDRREARRTTRRLLGDMEVALSVADRHALNMMPGDPMGLALQSRERAGVQHDHHAARRPPDPEREAQVRAASGGPARGASALGTGLAPIHGLTTLHALNDLR